MGVGLKVKQDLDAILLQKTNSFLKHMFRPQSDHSQC